MVLEWLQSINEYIWIATNLLTLYIAFALVVFTVGYYILFDPKATTAGKFIWRFVLSLVGVVGIIIVGVYVDPSHNRHWLIFPEDISWWRPLLRLVVYSYVAYTVTGLAVLLAVRKWRPRMIKKKSTSDLVTPRNKTSEIPVIKLKGEK